MTTVEMEQMRVQMPSIALETQRQIDTSSLLKTLIDIAASVNMPKTNVSTRLDTREIGKPTSLQRSAWKSFELSNSFEGAQIGMSLALAWAANATAEICGYLLHALSKRICSVLAQLADGESNDIVRRIAGNNIFERKGDQDTDEMDLGYIGNNYTAKCHDFSSRECTCRAPGGHAHDPDGSGSNSKGWVNFKSMATPGVKRTARKVATMREERIRANTLKTRKEEERTRRIAASPAAISQLRNSLINGKTHRLSRRKLATMAKNPRRLTRWMLIPPTNIMNIVPTNMDTKIARSSRRKPTAIATNRTSLATSHCVLSSHFENLIVSATKILSTDLRNWRQRWTAASTYKVERIMR